MESNDRELRRSKIKIRILSAIFLISVGLMIAFGVGIFLEMRETGQGQSFYSAVAVEFKPRIIAPLPAPLVINPDTQDAAEPTETEFVPFMDFDALREQFPNIVGWIQSQGTIINYPIVQGTDNDFYLDHLPDGTRHRWGSIYLDYRNAPDLTDSSIIIYGHDMASGDMFGSFLHYHNQDYFEQHPSMFIFTPTGNYLLTLFAGYVLDATQEHPPMFFIDEAAFDMYISDIRNRSIFTSDVEVNFGDRVVFLATCTRGGSRHGRLIIVGKLDALQ